MKYEEYIKLYENKSTEQLIFLKKRNNLTDIAKNALARTLDDRGVSQDQMLDNHTKAQPINIQPTNTEENIHKLVNSVDTMDDEIFNVFTPITDVSLFAILSSIIVRLIFLCYMIFSCVISALIVGFSGDSGGNPVFYYLALSLLTHIITALILIFTPTASLLQPHKLTRIIIAIFIISGLPTFGVMYAVFA